jgi:hypothetical protein
LVNMFAEYLRDLAQGSIGYGHKSPPRERLVGEPLSS